MDKSALDWIEKTLCDAGVHIMGSRTFHDIAAYWATSSDQLAEPMNKIPKVVFSKGGVVDKTSSEQTTQVLKDATQIDNDRGINKSAISPCASTWTNAAVATDLVAGITKLKQQEGKYILAHGGASFTQDLVKHGMIDEYRLVIHPVVLGKGIALFALAPNQMDLQFVSSVPLVTGIIANVYTLKNK
jgi:dihydrofolate reductase